MNVKSLEILNFRNLLNQNLVFNLNHNFFFGDNAQGKTNILEAIYILCLAKSFRVREDVELIPFGKEAFSIDGRFLGEFGIERHVGVSYSLKQGKRIHVDGKKINKFSQLVGQFPIVVLSSDDFSITTGPPSQRRRFFNILFSQSSLRYLEDLKEYEKILKQRNSILQKAASGKSAPKELLDVWNTQLVSKGCSLINFRAKMVAELEKNLNKNYHKISQTDDTLLVQYLSNIKYNKESELEENFNKALRSFSWKEKKRGTTLCGPHRDEYFITIGGRDLRKYGSRGEHKSTLVSLKASEAEFLKNKTNTNPILLLDDLYSELDKDRGDNVLSLFSDEYQTFITGTSFDYEAVQSFKNNDHLKTVFFVNNGQVGGTTEQS
jgi:DNA replication and repair protein RecF